MDDDDVKWRRKNYLSLQQSGQWKKKGINMSQEWEQNNWVDIIIQGD